MSNLLPGSLFNVAGHSVAITGAASGIGRMLAKGFAVNGSIVFLVDINESMLLESKSECEIAASSVGTKPQLHTITADLSIQSGINATIATIISLSSSLDTLIHCAAIRHQNPITYSLGSGLAKLQEATSSTSFDAWTTAFQLNVMTPYFLTAGLIELLGEATKKGDGRGSVILFSSPASVHNHQFVPAYQTTKAAIDHLTRVLAAEFGEFYIRVNAMSPGLVPSAMTDVNDPTSNFHLAGETPAKRVATEEDMLGTAIFLSSKAGAYMDGQIVRVDGGRLLTLRGANK